MASGGLSLLLSGCMGGGGAGWMLPSVRLFVRQRWAEEVWRVQEVQVGLLLSGPLGGSRCCDPSVVSGPGARAGALP